jgi:hypothetical protein
MCEDTVKLCATHIFGNHIETDVREEQVAVTGDMCGPGQLKYQAPGFEFCSRHGCMHFYVMFSGVGRGLAVG